MEYYIFIYHASLAILLRLLYGEARSRILGIAIYFVFLGVGGNLLVVVANDGRMPVFVKNISRETQIDLHESHIYQEGNGNTKLRYLSDFIPIKNTQRIMSPGDVGMICGIALLIMLIVCGLSRIDLQTFFHNKTQISYSIMVVAMIVPWLMTLRLIVALPH